jgi:hypothetical protein
VSSESRLIEPSVLDACVESFLKPDPTGELFIGIDAAVKHDCASVVWFV